MMRRPTSWESSEADVSFVSGALGEVVGLEPLNKEQSGKG